MDELQQAFTQESTEQLEQLEDTLLLLEKNPDDPEAINTLFRSAHTIKGAAGVVECDFIVAFTHVMENLLDELRSGHLTVTADLIAALLRCKDHISALLGVFAAGEPSPGEELSAQGEALQTQLRRLLPQAGGTVQVAPEQQSREAESLGSGSAVGHDSWHISLRFGSDVLRKGMDPLSFLRYLATLGEIAHLTTLYDVMPPAAEMDPEACYLGFEIEFRSSANKAAIERVFEFVRDDCLLRILPPYSRLAEYIQLIQELPEDTMRLGEILVRSGAITQEDLAAGLHVQSLTSITGGTDEAAAPPPPPIGTILVKQQVVQKEIVEAAVAKQTQVKDKKALEARLIRVHADKLDALIDLVGELVISGASASLHAQRSKDGALQEATAEVSRLVEAIRDDALQLRMVQIGETFNRFHRVVRDVSRELGKEIELVISGAETELDKSVVEKIGDPLMHLVRNAMDHGIETPQQRAANGKPGKGRLALNAYHDSGSIVIEVADDGAGLNRERILAKAVERGLVKAGDLPSDNELFMLIFEAGFSTVDQVTDLSGRGVGMDVVRRNIEALRGTVEVESKEGLGTTVRIRLPLTLAIIDGFLVGVGKASYVIPLDSVVECMELDANATAGRNYLNLRGEVLPFLRLRDLFEVRGESNRRQNIVVVECAGQKAGLVVDHLLGEFQTVIKPLSRLFRRVQGISGSTILGTGEVALILDVQPLVRVAAQRENVASHGQPAPAAFGFNP